MNFIKKNKTLLLFIVIISLAIVVVFISRNKNDTDYFDKKNFNKRYSKDFSIDFTMKQSEGLLKNNFKNIVITIDNKKYVANIVKIENTNTLVLTDENLLTRKIQLIDEISNEQFINKSLDEYMNSCLKMMIHLSYNMYMDEAHKFMETLDKDNRKVNTNYYLLNNKLLITHSCSFYGEGKNLFEFNKDGSIAITKYKGGK